MSRVNERTGKALMVAGGFAFASTCFVQPLTPASSELARAQVKGQSAIGASDSNAGIPEGAARTGAVGLTVAAAALACGRLAKGHKRQPNIACNFIGGGQQGFANEVGAQTPLGYWDPLGLSTGPDGGNKFRRYREVEIKHGRLAMMAAVGLLAQTLTRLPGFEDTPPGIDGHFFAVGPVRSTLVGILISIAVCESLIFLQDKNKEPGNFGDPVGLGNYTFDMRNGELNNGRVAMLSFFLIAIQNYQTGKNAGQLLGLIN